jgi:hypothetical protein
VGVTFQARFFLFVGLFFCRPLSSFGLADADLKVLIFSASVTEKENTLIRSYTLDVLLS